MFLIATLANGLSPDASTSVWQKRMLLADMGIAISLLTLGSILYAGGTLSHWDFAMVQEAPIMISVASIGMLSDVLVFFINKKVHYHYFVWEKQEENRLVRAEDQTAKEEEEYEALIRNIHDDRRRLEEAQFEDTQDATLRQDTQIL